MATLRSHITVERPVDKVWAVIGDAGSISDWFPMVQTSSATGEDRHRELDGGVPLDES